MHSLTQPPTYDNYFYLLNAEGSLASVEPGPEVIKLFPSSTQLSMKFFLLINVKMPTIVGILTFMRRKKIAFSAYLSLKKVEFLIFLYLRVSKISCSTELSMKKV